jgi:serine/threonine protein kinase
MGRHLVDSAFRLERYVGGDGDAAVFETEFQGNPAAIKIVSGTPESVESLIALWTKSTDLSHPALVKVLTTGRTELDEIAAAYTVMERAEDNLAAVLAERPLTPEETQEMITPILDVLQYLHANGFAHGRLKPPNIMAFDNQLKVSSDNLTPGGDPAADGRAIGPLLKEVLGTTRLAEPFAGIAGNAARWKEANAQNDPGPAAVLPAARSKYRGVLWAAAAGIGVALGLTLFLPPKEPSAAKATAVEPTPAPPSETQKAPSVPKDTKTSKQQPESTARETPMGPLTPGAQSTSVTRQSASEGVTQVLPDIPTSARNTITGSVRINIRVRVDNAGNVTEATPESPMRSKYFTDRALTASRSWKFPPGSGPEDWILRFELTRDQIRASSTKLN